MFHIRVSYLIKTVRSWKYAKATLPVESLGQRLKRVEFQRTGGCEIRVSLAELGYGSPSWEDPPLKLRSLFFCRIPFLGRPEAHEQGVKDE